MLEFYGSCQNDLKDHFTVDETAGKFGLPSSEVLAMCKKGLIDSFPVYAPDHSLLRPVYDGDIEQFPRDGPNRLFTFDEAVEHAQHGLHFGTPSGLPKPASGGRRPTSR